MAQGFDGIITQLEQQKAAIDKALAALRDVDANGAATVETPVAEQQAPATRKRGMTPEGKARLVAALKKRWAAKKRADKKAAATAPAGSPATAPAPAKRKSGGMTEDGRKRLAETMKKRWAVKRAAAKKGRKKAA
jgi:hypothetical protein